MTLNEYESTYPPRQLPAGAEVTRVAPSPTGRPHIGTAFQALIDRALADQTGGLFLLRIEDTDRKRLVEEAVGDILSSLEWLNVIPDEGPHVGGAYGPYTQSERLPLYQTAARWLVEQGHAYYCFCTPERLESVRQEQMAAGQQLMYDRHCACLPTAEAEERLARGEKAVIRMRVPENTRISFIEPLRGEISFDSAMVDDQVLLKSDGFPTYHLAVVVDDHFMRITTAVRGEEWVSSAPKHLLLYQYFGWQVPRILHTPLLRDASRRKLSKRTGDISIEAFRAQGYLREGFRNFLSRIIWAHPEEKDIYSYEEFVRLFSVGSLSKAAPVADYDLLDFIDGQYLRQLGPAALYDEVVAWLEWLLRRGEAVAFDEVKKGERVPRPVSPEELQRFAAAFSLDRAYSEKVLTLEPERFKKLSDIVLQYSLFFPALFGAADPDLLAKPLAGAEATAAMLHAFVESYSDADAHEVWETKVRQQADAAGTKPRHLFMAIRIAVTGSEQTPPLFEIMQILGRDEVERRIALSLKALNVAE
ncbi:MAG: glutamate--tRNA ligase [Anaerolineae bacterium]